MQKSVGRVISSVLRDLSNAISYVSGDAGIRAGDPSFCVLGGSSLVEYTSEGSSIGVTSWNGCIPKNPSCMSVSRDGRLFAVGSIGVNPDLVILDRESGDLKSRLEDHDTGVSTICFSQDSKYLFSVGTSSDGCSYVFNVEDWSVCASFRFSSAFVIFHSTSGGFVKDVKRRSTTAYLFACCGPSTLALATFSPEKGELSFAPTSVRTVRDFTSVVFSGNGDVLVVSTSAGELVVVHTRSNAAVGNYVTATGSGGIKTLAVKGEKLFAGCRDGSVWVYKMDLESMSLNLMQRICVDKQGSITSLSVNGSGEQVLVGTSQGSVFLISSDSSPPVNRVNHFPTCGIAQLLPDSTRESFLCLSNQFVRYTLGESETSFDVVVSSGSLEYVCGSASRMLSLLATEDRIFGLDNASKKFVWDFPVSGATKVELTRSLRNAVVSTLEGEVRMYDLRSKEMRISMKEHNGKVTDLKMFSDELFAISCGRDRNIFTYDLAVGRQVTCHRSGKSGISSLIVSGDQTSVVAASSSEKRLVFWDLRVMDPVNVISLESHCVESLCVLEDSVRDLKWLGAGTAEGSVLLFDLRAFQSPWETMPFVHNGIVNSVLAYPSGIISGGSDNTICYCNFSFAGSCSRIVKQHQPQIAVPFIDFQTFAS